jgi:hypothetical protein
MSELNTTPETPESIDDGIPEVSFTVQVEETVQAPIDPTLTIEGEAADAKATGDAIAALKEELEAEIEAIDTGVDSVPGKLFPVGAIYVSTSATAPTFGGTSWRWKEIMIPVTQGDLIDGSRSYQEKGTGDTPGTLHFWLRIADAEE